MLFIIAHSMNKCSNDYCLVRASLFCFPLPLIRPNKQYVRMLSQYTKVVIVWWPGSESLTCHAVYPDYTYIRFGNITAIPIRLVCEADFVMHARLWLSWNWILKVQSGHKMNPYKSFIYIIIRGRYFSLNKRERSLLLWTSRVSTYIRELVWLREWL